MRRLVETYNTLVGFHYYPNVPKFCSYLSERHRHQFTIKCQFEVFHNEREIEINEQQNKLYEFLANSFGNPCEFGDMSCESIAERIMTEFNAYSVTVLEDNYGGATLTR